MTLSVLAMLTEFLEYNITGSHSGSGLTHDVSTSSWFTSTDCKSRSMLVIAFRSSPPAMISIPISNLVTTKIKKGYFAE